MSLVSYSGGFEGNKEQSSPGSLWSGLSKCFQSHSSGDKSLYRLENYVRRQGVHINITSIFSSDFYFFSFSSCSFSSYLCSFSIFKDNNTASLQSSISLSDLVSLCYSFSCPNRQLLCKCLISYKKLLCSFHLLYSPWPPLAFLPQLSNPASFHHVEHKFERKSRKFEHMALHLPSDLGGQ